jgi:hypothetical protein
VQTEKPGSKLSINVQVSRCSHQNFFWSRVQSSEFRNNQRNTTQDPWTCSRRSTNTCKHHQGATANIMMPN